MTFARSSNGNISSNTDFDDIDVYIINSKSGASVASSISSYDNVEIIEYTFTSSGNYSLKLNPYRIKDTASGVMAVASWKLI